MLFLHLIYIMSIPGKKYGMEVDLRVSTEGHYERLLVMMRTVVWLDYWKNRELESGYLWLTFLVK